MTVRVNLLPEEIGERQRVARGRGMAAASGAVLLLALGGVYAWQGMQVSNARATLASEQEALQALQADRGELAPYAELNTRQSSSMSLLETVLSGEASVAGVMQDLATVLPSDVQLEAVAISMGEPETTIGDQRPALGTLTLDGLALDGHAPGLERVLLELDKLSAFSDVFFTDSTVEMDESGASSGAASFSIQVDLGPEVLTNRYLDGLPEELR